MTTTIEELSTLTLFEGCEPGDLQQVMSALTGARNVQEGEVICTEGDRATEWWIVIDGLADVTARGRYVATIGPGETIGELALLDAEPRNATVIAATDMVVQVVNGEGFVDALLSSPKLAVGMLRQLAVRLRGANDRSAGSRGPTDPAASPALSVREASPSEASPRTELEVAFNPYAPGFFQDPYPFYAALRDRDPVHDAASTGSYVITSYADVHRLNRDRSLMASITYASSTPAIEQERERIANSGGQEGVSMLGRDGEDHTRLRRLVTKAFTPRNINLWKERAETLVEELLAEAMDREEVDLIADYALKLPAQIISEMLGMPQGDIPQLRSWSHAISKTLDPLNSPEETQAAMVAIQNMSRYLKAVIEDKRAHPSDDILSDLIRARYDDDRLSTIELRSQVFTLYIAGHETTLNLIGNGIANLLRFPDELDRLRTDPGLDANAIEELLRFDSPVQFTRRIAAEPVEVGPVTIPAGAVVTLGLASGNRDPQKWGPTVDRIDLGRSGANEHLSFGAGSHYCLGASLARLEGQIALPRFVRRFPRMTPAYETPVWSERMVLRGVERLPLSLRG